MLGLVGFKRGMTRIYDESGVSYGVTVIEMKPNRIAQMKNSAKEGYDAIQLAYGEKKSSRVNKASAGHFVKANINAGQGLREFRIEDETQLADFKVGQELSIADLFKEGQQVDVCGISRGKGFAGTVKRHGFKTQDATHGNSLSHRAPGSIGQCQFPGKVFKGKKMSGRLGNVRCSIQSQTILKIDADRGLILLKGGAPGAPHSWLVITPAVKHKNKKEK